MKRTAEDAAMTRTSLLDAALMAFEEKGWRGATFEYVADRAGVTRGALNHHFQDKATLLREALEWGWSEYEERLFRAVADRGAQHDAASLLHVLISHFANLLTSDSRFRALASTTVLVAPQAFGHTGEKDALDSWHEQIVSALDASAMRKSSLSTDEIANLALVLLQGFTVTAVTRPQDFPYLNRVDAVVSALVAGLLT